MKPPEIGAGSDPMDENPESNFGPNLSGITHLVPSLEELSTSLHAIARHTRTLESGEVENVTPTVKIAFRALVRTLEDSNEQL